VTVATATANGPTFVARGIGAETIRDLSACLLIDDDRAKAVESSIGKASAEESGSG